MKKILFSLALLLFFINANSQLTKGNWLVGGNTSYSSETTSNSLGGQNYRIEIKGNAGYFIANRLTTGLRPDMFF